MLEYLQKLNNKDTTSAITNSNQSVGNVPLSDNLTCHCSPDFTDDDLNSSETPAEFFRLSQIGLILE